MNPDRSGRFDQAHPAIPHLRSSVGFEEVGIFPVQNGELQTQAAASLHLHGNYYQRFGFRWASAAPWMHAADIGFVDLDAAVSRSRPGRTIVRRSLCSHVHAVL